MSIAVGYSQTDFLYSISATSSMGVSQLVNGVPQSGYVAAGSYAYFNFTPAFAGPFSIFCTALTGDPDLYVSTSGLPSNTSFTWVSATDVDEVISILPSDPNWRGPPAWYAIAVYGYSGNVSFAVMARMLGQNTTSALTDGVPQAGLAPPHDFAYFTFQMASRYPLGVPNPGLDVGVVPRSGTCDVYVSNLTTTTTDVRTGITTTVPIFPRPVCLFYGSGGVCYVYGVDNSTYTWSSAQQGSQNFVSIGGKQLYPNETFVIGVFATSRDPAPGQLAPPTLFTVVAATGATTMELPMGQAVPGVVTRNQYKFYRLTTTSWGMDVVVAGARGLSIKGAGDATVLVANISTATGFYPNTLPAPVVGTDKRGSPLYVSLALPASGNASEIVVNAWSVATGARVFNSTYACGFPSYLYSCPPLNSQQPLSGLNGLFLTNGTLLLGGGPWSSQAYFQGALPVVAEPVEGEEGGVRPLDR